MEEVRRHCRPDDAWLVMEGSVYDVTDWQHSHPGGKHILLAHAGKDVTREFNSLDHSANARLLRSGLLVGTVSDYKPPARAVELDPLLASATGTGGPEPATAGEGQAGSLVDGFEERRGKRKKVVVIGSGIVGVSAAYFLSKRGDVDVTLLSQVLAINENQGKQGFFLDCAVFGECAGLVGWGCGIVVVCNIF